MPFSNTSAIYINIKYFESSLFVNTVYIILQVCQVNIVYVHMIIREGKLFISSYKSIVGSGLF